MKRSLLLILTIALGLITTKVVAQNNDTIIEPKNATSGIEQTAEFNPHLAPKGYRGFVELGIANSLVFSTTHGYQFSHSTFLGGGAGYFDNFKPKDRQIFVPIYLAIQGNAGKKLAQFTYGARFGILGYHRYYYINSKGDDVLSTSAGITGLYTQLNMGLRLGFTPDFALALKPQMGIMYTGSLFIFLVVNLGFEF